MKNIIVGILIFIFFNVKGQTINEKEFFYESFIASSNLYWNDYSNLNRYLLNLNTDIAVGYSTASSNIGARVSCLFNKHWMFSFSTFASNQKCYFIDTLNQFQSGTFKQFHLVMLPRADYHWGKKRVSNSMFISYGLKLKSTKLNVPNNNPDILSWYADYYNASEIVARFGFSLRYKIFKKLFDNRLGMNLELATGDPYFSCGFIFSTNGFDDSYNIYHDKDKQQLANIVDDQNKKLADAEKEANNALKDKIEAEEKAIVLEAKLAAAERKAKEAEDKNKNLESNLLENQKIKDKKNSKETSNNTRCSSIKNIQIIDPNSIDKLFYVNHGKSDFNLLDDELINYDINGVELKIEEEKNTSFNIWIRDGFSENNDLIKEETGFKGGIYKLEDITDFDKVIIQIQKKCKNGLSSMFEISFIMN